jgi:hypothetical protein
MLSVTFHANDFVNLKRTARRETVTIPGTAVEPAMDRRSSASPCSTAPPRVPSTNGRLND